MRIKMTVEIYAHRSLKGIDSYYKMDEVPADTVYAIPDGQKIIGIYKNDLDIQNNGVIITDQSVLILLEGNVTRIDYIDVENADLYPEENRLANSVKVRLKNNMELYIPIKGKTDGASDVFEFFQFIRKVYCAFGLKKESKQVYVGEVGSQSGSFVGGTEQIVVVKPWAIEGLEVISSGVLK